MHPQFNTKRRSQRAQALHEKYRDKHDVHYVDAAEYRRHGAFSTVSHCPSNQVQRNFLTIRSPYPATAEEAAVALALSQKPTPSTVITDYKTAVQNFPSSFISPQAVKILQQAPPTSPVEIMWAAAHAGL